MIFGFAGLWEQLDLFDRIKMPNLSDLPTVMLKGCEVMGIGSSQVPQPTCYWSQAGLLSI